MILEKTFTEEDIKMMDPPSRKLSDTIPKKEENHGEMKEETPEQAPEPNVDDGLVSESIIEPSKATTKLNFTFDDPSVPAGWGIRMMPNGPKSPPRKIFCDPNGIVFTSRKEAYEFMVKSHYEEEDLKLMRRHMINQKKIIKDEKESKVEVIDGVEFTRKFGFDFISAMIPKDDQVMQKRMKNIR